MNNKLLIRTLLATIFERIAKKETIKIVRNQLKKKEKKPGTPSFFSDS
jgi:hypothetical protein